ncbi:C40 family peptidase [Bacillus badius]|uniref:C40 family peptidase n=1 Tax=Bacillus badius TaxID=1455 RepID=UPI0005ADF07C|nr:NlpC/P60 family protein [Bacillus badius]KIL72552.1 NLP/P60 family protein [Bacillus badius]
MIELFLVKPDYMMAIPVSTVTWSGQRYQAARKIEANILYSDTGLHFYQQVIEGDTLLFKWKGNELFRGTVFNRSRNKNGQLTLIAYDMLQYFLINKDIYNFSGKRLDEILVKMCKDSEVPHGSFVNTKEKVGKVIDQETPLYDIALRAMIDTHKVSKRKFHIYSRLGKIHLTELKKQDIQWVLEVGNNIIDYTYDTSIEETATRVKLASGEGDKTVTAIVTDSEGKKQFGVIQHFEKVSESLNKSALTKKGKEILNKKKGVKKKLDVEALGIESATSGNAIYAIIDDIRLKRTMYIDTDIHTFVGNKHTMNLHLIETNDFPEMEELTSSAPSGSSTDTGTVGGSPKAQEVVTLAKSYIGRLKYDYGGKNIARGSGDCSGFTKFIYKKVGIDIGDGTATQIKKGRKIEPSAAQAGDLVFFKGTIKERGPNAVSHVGIVTKPGYCVSLGNSGCKEHGYLRSNHSYWGPKFMQINRVL